MPEIRKKRVPIPERSPKERVKDIKEVELGYTPELAMEEAQRCLQCKNPPCVSACPVQVDIPRFVSQIAQGRFDEAYMTIMEAHPFPSICGRVCPQENQCEGACTLGKIGDPVAIGALERFAGDWGRKRSLGVVKPKEKVKGSVAIVGSGPAGLACAYELAKGGVERIVVFEAMHELGGVLVYGIPEFRLPKEIVFEEIRRLKEVGVEFRKNIAVGLTIPLEEIVREFDAVFIGVGAGVPRLLNIPGENLNGVYSANEFLTRLNLMRAYLFPEYDTPIKVGKKVVVIGGGNVAMDAARWAKRLGADVTVAYRRTRKEMPARLPEIRRAEEEGVKFEFLVAPVKIIGDENFWVREIEFVRMKLGEPDESGRRRPIPIKGSNFRLPADTVIVAIGNLPNKSLFMGNPPIERTKRGTIAVNPKTGKTSMPNVWAGGDIVTGAATVILAMGAGKTSAKDIIGFLKEKSK